MINDLESQFNTKAPVAKYAHIKIISITINHRIIFRYFLSMQKKAERRMPVIEI